MVTNFDTTVVASTEISLADRTITYVYSWDSNTTLEHFESILIELGLWGEQTSDQSKKKTMSHLTLVDTLRKRRLSFGIQTVQNGICLVEDLDSGQEQ